MNMKLFSRVIIFLLMIVGVVVASNSTMAQQGDEKQIKLIYVEDIEQDKPIQGKEIWLSYYDEVAKK